MLNEEATFYLFSTLTLPLNFAETAIDSAVIFGLYSSKNYTDNRWYCIHNFVRIDLTDGSMQARQSMVLRAEGPVNDTLWFMPTDMAALQRCLVQVQVKTIDPSLVIYLLARSWQLFSSIFRCLEETATNSGAVRP